MDVATFANLKYISLFMYFQLEDILSFCLSLNESQQPIYAYMWILIKRVHASLKNHESNMTHSTVELLTAQWREG